MKLKVFFSLLVLFFSASTIAQINITDPDYTPVDCSTLAPGAGNFFDDGDGGNYGPNRRDTITVCPDLAVSSKLTLSFNTDFGFNVDPTDTLYFFDGPNVSSPSLGMLNSGINPSGAAFQTTFDNPSGCMTIVFHSDGASETAGFAGNLACSLPPQPFDIHVEAYVNNETTNSMNPLDTGYVDICLGDSVLLVAKPNFLHSLETAGFGYSQNMNNVDIHWEFADGTEFDGNDSIWFTPNLRTGYYIDLSITDDFPQTLHSISKIRVSQKPDFYTAGPIVNPICAFSEGILVGGVSATDTAGVDLPTGAFLIGGTTAGLTYLPDGTGAVYSTAINMDQFADTTLFREANDLQTICLTMEHTFIGDLEIWLTCPNGTEVSLVNCYSPGHIANGFGGDGTFLGDANDGADGTPGVGWEYCFSGAYSTLETMGDEWSNGNFVTTSSGSDAMNPDGIYLLDGVIEDLVGCPLNGDWTISVQDNQGIDDGFIFEWSIAFDANLYPNNETYQNYVVSANWVNDPTIVDVLADTAIVVNPGFPGTYNYTFEMMDDYGCHYDTTISISVMDTVKLIGDALLCDLDFEMTGNLGLDNGSWTVLGTPGTTFDNSTAMNTTAHLPMNGIYYLIYTDACNFDDTIRVNRQFPFFEIAPVYDCPNATEMSVLGYTIDITQFSWDPTLPIFDNQYSAPLPKGTYQPHIENSFGCMNDTTVIIDGQAKINLATQADVCGLDLDMTANPQGTVPGNWSMISGTSNAAFEDETDVNTTIEVAAYGNYVFTYTETVCDDSDTISFAFLKTPDVVISPVELCAETSLPYTIVATSDLEFVAYDWNTGENTSSIVVNEGGLYTVYATNSCGTDSSTAMIDIRNCQVNFPNVFTPGTNDALNPVFKVLVPTNGINTFHCQIFNRWGNLVYEYNDSFGGWDGKAQNGEDCNPGTYFYKLEGQTFVGSEVQMSGFFQLIRD